jgi:hypothetical protein
MKRGFRRAHARQFEAPAPREPSITHEVDDRRLIDGPVDVRPDRIVSGDKVSGPDEQPLTIRGQGHATCRPEKQLGAALGLEQ